MRPVVARGVLFRVLSGWCLAIAAAACHDGGGAALPVDAPVDADADAAVDAPVDAPVDAAIDAPPAGPVTVRVMRPFTPAPAVPLAGIRVFASAPDGSLGASGVTAADGTVTVPVVPGGSVTAVVTDDGRYRLLSTIVGVEPGDSLTIDPQRPPPVINGAAITYRWPQTPDADNALLFDAVMINDGCWEREVITFAPDPPPPPLATSTTLGLVPGCGTDPRDVVIAHYDSDHLARYAVLHGVPAAAGTQTVAAWSLPDATFTARAINVPPYVHGYGATPSPLVHGHAFVGRGSRVPPMAGSATAQTSWTSAFPAARVWHHLGSNLYGVLYCYDDAPAGALSVTFDVATSLAMVGQATIDPITRRITWTRDAGPDPDEIRATLTYYGSGLQPDVEWSLRAAGHVDSLRLPTLPAELAAATVQPGFSTHVAMSFYDLGTVHDWATMRALPFWVPELDAAVSDRWGRACRSF